MPHVLVVGPIHQAGIDLLQTARGVTVEIADTTTADRYAPRVGDADALLIRTQPLPAEVIARANRLAIVSRHGVGFDAVDVAALDARGIPLTIVGDVNSRTVAEHTMALMLSMAKRIPAYDTATRTGGWAIRNSFSAFELWGKTLLLIGFGRIGRLVAGMAGGFGMTILAYDSLLGAESIRSAGAEPVALEDGLRRADVVSLHVPKTGTGPLIGAKELALMRPGSFLINTARGGLIDEPALAAVLEAGRIAGAGIDVFTTEPPPLDLALLRSSRTIVTPHTAGLTQDCAIRMAQVAAQNILDFFAGRLDPALVINPAVLDTPRPTAPG